MHRCVVVAAGLVDDIKQRPKRGSKTASPAQKNLPLFAVAAGAATPILGSRAKVQNRNAHGKGGCYIPYTRYRRKKRRRGPSLLLLRVEVGRSESDGGEV